MGSALKKEAMELIKKALEKDKLHMLTNIILMG